MQASTALSSTLSVWTLQGFFDPLYYIYIKAVKGTIVCYSGIIARLCRTAGHTANSVSLFMTLLSDCMLSCFAAGVDFLFLTVVLKKVLDAPWLDCSLWLAQPQYHRCKSAGFSSGLTHLAEPSFTSILNDSTESPPVIPAATCCSSSTVAVLRDLLTMIQYNRPCQTSRTLLIGQPSSFEHIAMENHRSRGAYDSNGAVQDADQDEGTRIQRLLALQLVGPHGPGLCVNFPADHFSYSRRL